MDESSDLLDHTATSPFWITLTIRPSKHQNYKAFMTPLWKALFGGVISNPNL
jgi:hypothetical protein